MRMYLHEKRRDYGLLLLTWFTMYCRGIATTWICDSISRCGQNLSRGLQSPHVSTILISAGINIKWWWIGEKAVNSHWIKLHRKTLCILQILCKLQIKEASMDIFSCISYQRCQFLQTRERKPRQTKSRGLLMCFWHRIRSGFAIPRSGLVGIELNRSQS